MITQLFNQDNTQENLLSSEIQKMHEFAENQNIDYPNFINYISICDWVIRRQEYNFIITYVDEYTKHATSPLKILDIGCGVVPLCNRFSLQGHEVFACDPIKEDIEFLNSHDLNTLYGSNVAYAHTYGEQLEFEDESFDIVYMASVLEHIPTGNDELVIREALRVLKKGGLFVITTDVIPFYDSLTRSYAQAFDVQTLKPITELFTTAAGDEMDDQAAIFEKLNHLTWEDVYSFWKKTKQSDEREDEIRHYLAVGFSFIKENSLSVLSCEEKCSLLMRGESVLINDYYRLLHQTMEKEAVIQEKEKAIHELYKDLAQKEKIINTLQKVSIFHQFKKFIKGRK
jgi:2-polyprenyl-3-methyl-5-hydroxy-6-metoxy-1,4-benzoquinol methylase